MSDSGRVEQLEVARIVDSPRAASVKGSAAARAAIIAVGLVVAPRIVATLPVTATSRFVEKLSMQAAIVVCICFIKKIRALRRLAKDEFSDFECLFCARHARQVYPRLVEEYVDTGKVQYVFRHYPPDIR